MIANEINKLFVFMMEAPRKELKAAFIAAGDAQCIDSYFWDMYTAQISMKRPHEISIMFVFNVMANISQQAFLDYVSKWQ